MPHALERTSPKRQDFVGRCIKCGKEHLPINAASQDCPMDKIVSDEQALLELL